MTDFTKSLDDTNRSELLLDDTTRSTEERVKVLLDELPEVPGYSIETKLGEGGMGAVFKAMHLKLGRLVALKMIHGGKTAGSRELLRFLAEAEAVAAIDHPNVVKVYDTGDAKGQLFIAMEYLPGGSLADRFAKNRLKARDVAELVRKLALAVQAAHERQIVHRDLKPGNVMFDAAGEPKITDFGLAKRASGDLTMTNAIMGTPAYMAPEQAKGESKFVGPQADVWALGVILYEALSGRKPFPGRNDFEILHNVIDGEPTRLRSISREVPGDLDLIVQKCLSKEPEARYAHASELAADLQNWLDAKPLSIKPAGVVERSAKWVKRNKLPAAVMAASLLAAIAMGGLAVWAIGESRRADDRAAAARNAEALAEVKAREASAQAKRADEEATRAKVTGELTSFLRELFLAADPTGLAGNGLLPAGQGGRKVTAEQLLTQGAGILKDKFRGGSDSDQLTRASLLAVVGDVLRSLGLMDNAKPMLEEALAIRMKLLPADHSEILANRFILANWHAEKGNFYEAETLYLANIAAYEARSEAETPPAATAMVRLSVLYSSIADDRGKAWARKGLAVRRKLYGENHRETAIAHLVLATNLYENSPKAAIRETEAGLKILQGNDTIESDQSLQAVIKYQLGLTMWRGGFNDLAIRNLEDAVVMLERGLGDGHIYTTIVLHDLGGVYADNGQWDKADAAWAKCLDTVRKTVGLEHPRAINLVGSLSKRAAEKGEFAVGLALFQEALAGIDKRYGPEAPWKLRVLSEAIGYCDRYKHADDAKPFHPQAVALLDNPKVLLRAQDVVRYVRLVKRRSDAAGKAALDRYFARVLADPQLAADPEREYQMRLLMVLFLGNSGRYDRALPHCERLSELWNHPTVKEMVDPGDKAEVCLHRMQGAWQAGQYDEAEASLKTILDEAKRGNSLANARELAMMWHLHRGRRDAARAEIVEFLAVRDLEEIDQAWACCVLSQLSDGKPSASERALIVKQLERKAKSKNEDITMYKARAAAMIDYQPKTWLNRVNAEIVAHPEDIGLKFAKAALGLRLNDAKIVHDAVAALARDKLNHYGKLRYDYYAAMAVSMTDPMAAADRLKKIREAIEKYLVDWDAKNDPSLEGYRFSALLELRNAAAAMKK